MELLDPNLFVLALALSAFKLENLWATVPSLVIRAITVDLPKNFPFLFPSRPYIRKPIKNEYYDYENTHPASINNLTKVE